MMKYFFLLVILVIVGCDKELTYDYTFQNKSPYTVYLTYESHIDNSYNHTVLSEDSIIITTSTGFGNSVYELDLKNLFKSFSLRTDSLYSDSDYTENKYWEYTEFSDTHAEFRLIVDSTHFKYNIKSAPAKGIF